VWRSTASRRRSAACDDALGGSATFFSAAASLFCPVQLVGVVGHDFPLEELDFLEQRGVDLAGSSRPRARASAGPASTAST
jgi:hypothetical protein